jgi:DNA-binding NarL/FixJ family response regulator
VDTQSIILLDNSRLVRDMLRRVINKAPGLKIVAEVEDLSEYPDIARQTSADWTILLLDPDEEVPAVVEEVLNRLTLMRLLVMAVDGSQVRMRWTEPHEKSLDDKNLEDLLTILRRDGSV